MWVDPAHASPWGIHRHANGLADVGVSRSGRRIARGWATDLPFSTARGIRRPQMKKPPNCGLFGTLGDRGLRGFGLLDRLAATLDEACAQILADFVQTLGPADDFEQGVALGGGLHHVAAEGEIGVGETGHQA